MRANNQLNDGQQFVVMLQCQNKPVLRGVREPFFNGGGGGRGKIKFYHVTLICTQSLEIVLIVNAI